MKSCSPVRYFLRLRLLAIVVLFLPLIPVQAGKGALINSDVAPATLTLAENARLKTELNWSFGGRSQRGWYLYQSLISRLIGTDSNPESGEFAAALSRWQKTAGLPPTGILDQETWMAMIATFQSRRLKGSAVPSSDQLIQAPAS